MLLKTRLNIISIASVLVTLCLAVIVISQFNTLIKSFESFRTTSSVAEKYTLMINRDLNYTSRLTRSIMLGDTFDKNFNKLESRIQDIEQQFKQLNTAIASIEGGDTALLNNVKQSQQDTLKFIYNGREQMARLKPNHHNRDARAAAWALYQKEASPFANKARASFRALQQNLNTSIEKSNNAMESAMSNARIMRYVIIAIVLFIILLGILNGALIQQGMRRLNKMRQMMFNIGTTSDLIARVSIKGGDEIAQTGKIFNDMLDQFQQIIQRVAHSSTDVKSASDQLGVVANQGRKDLNTQNMQISTAVSAMSQMRKSVEDVSSDAQFAADSASQAQHISNSGITLSNDAVASMNTLAEQTVQTTEVVKQLNDSCSQITTVLNVIETVSEQTNLLALNAAIEAARAGDQGRGFAVVADEVRSLAIRSQESTAQIQTIIDHLMRRSSEAVSAMDKNQQLAAQSVSTTSEIRQSMEQVMIEIDRIQKMNNSIAINVNEQSTAAAEIDNTMHQLQSLSQSSEQSSIEVETSSASLNNLADQVHTLVSRFKY